MKSEPSSQAVIFSVRKAGEPKGTAQCYEVDSGDWHEAVSAFQIEQALPTPVPVEVKRWDGNRWVFVVRLITKWSAPDASSRARRVQRPG